MFVGLGESVGWLEPVMLPVSVPVAGAEKVAVGVGESAGCAFEGEAGIGGGGWGGC